MLSEEGKRTEGGRVVWDYSGGGEEEECVDSRGEGEVRWRQKIHRTKPFARPRSLGGGARLVPTKMLEFSIFLLGQGGGF